VTRNRRSAKQAGAKFERVIADHLKIALDNDFIDRKVKTGSKDTGDIGGVRAHGQRIVLELKDYGGMLKAAEWLREADIERGNDDALAGIVIAKRRGTADPNDQIVLMDVRNLVALLTGEPQFNEPHIPSHVTKQT
jgi:hypothetical protein